MAEYSAPTKALDHPCRIQREASVVWTLEKKTERGKEEGERERTKSKGSSFGLDICLLTLSPLSFSRTLGVFFRGNYSPSSPAADP